MTIVVWSGRGRRPKALGPQTHKVCCKCGELKPVEDYYVRKNGVTRQATCKPCNTVAAREWAQKNAARHRENSNRWRQENSQRVRDLRRAAYEADPERHREYGRKYYQRNADDRCAFSRERRKRPEVIEKIRQYEREYRAKNLSAKLAHRLRSRVRSALQGRSKVGSAVSLLGCSIEVALEHIQSLFQPGMTWENWGTGAHGRREWHLDHVRPLASFDLENPEQFATACHYTNLQPLWAKQNHSKGARTEP